MLKETVFFTLTGCGKEELTLTVETHVHLFGKTRVVIDYAGAAKPRDFEWPDEAKTYIEQLMAKWEGPPIEGLGELLSELDRLNERSRARWRDAHFVIDPKSCNLDQDLRCEGVRKVCQSCQK